MGKIVKKIGVIGSGKTGSFVVNLINDHSQFLLHETFNSKNPPTISKLNECDGIIIFVNEKVLTQIMPIILKANKPVVCGTTGFDYSFYQADIGQTLPWIYASNFSLGIQLIKKLMNDISFASKIFNQVSFNIHEIHHTKKLDAPSGTALSMKKWLNKEVLMTHERVGDVVGFHELILKTDNETIKLSHEAFNREIFAEGALKSLEWIFEHKLTKGLYNFDTLFEKYIFNGDKS